MPTQPLTGYRLSLQQKDAWKSQLSGAPAELTRSVVLISGKLDPSALEAAVRKTVARHEILRTSFFTPTGMTFPFQVIHEPSTPGLFGWRITDLSGLGPQQQNATVENLVSETRADEHGSGFRIQLATLGQDSALLLVSAPVTLADAKTVGLLIEEIAGNYANPNTAPADAPLHYADYSEWQNEALESGAPQDPAGFWERQRAFLPNRFPLPFQRIEPTNEGESVVITSLSQELATDLDRIAREQNVAVSTLLLAGWHAVLARLTGEAEVAVATVLDCRTQPEFVKGMGPFNRVFLTHTSLESQPSWVDLAQSLEQDTRNAAELLNLRAADEPAAGASASTAFEFHDFPRGWTAGDVKLDLKVLQSPAANAKLKLAVFWPEARALEFSFDRSRITASDVEKIAAYFTRFLEGAVAGLNQPVAAIEILGEDERKRLTRDVSQGKAVSETPECVHFLFEEQARNNATSTALVFEDQTFTYGDLNSRANQIAHYLRGLGVGADTPVALCFERSPEMIIGLLGILKAQGAYVPVDPQLPRARQEYLLSDSRAAILLTKQDLAAQMAGSVPTTLCLDRDAHLFANQPATDPDHSNRPEDLAYIIYTSGSTGTPKGVAVEHRNLANYSRFIAAKLGALDQQLCFATVSTISADLGNTSIFPGLISGGCLHVISQQASLDGMLFARQLAKHPVDVLKITPSNLSALLMTNEGAHILPRKYLVLGGEASSWDLVRQIRGAGSCRIVNHYGPTETTVGCLTFDLLEIPEQPLSSTVPIGKPIDNASAFILDSLRHPVPESSPGELFIGGAGVARGYWNQPEKTAERFLPNPFGPGRVYRTGDRARFLPDGNIEFLGRVDNQVKIRGFRVELGEIEAVLSRHPLIERAAVLYNADHAGHERLIAYCVARQPIDDSVLRSFLQQSLPDYMIPAGFVRLDAMPLTPNGKLDTAALPSVESPVPQPGAADAAPHNAIEQKLVEIWSEVLAVPHVTVHDNFFDLGGHSLMATLVVSRIRAAFQVQIPLRGLFETPTVAGLAKTISELQSGSHEEDLSRILAELESLSDEEARMMLDRIENQGAEQGGGNH